MTGWGPWAAPGRVANGSNLAILLEQGTAGGANHSARIPRQGNRLRSLLHAALARGLTLEKGLQFTRCRVGPMARCKAQNEQREGSSSQLRRSAARANGAPICTHTLLRAYYEQSIACKKKISRDLCLGTRAQSPPGDEDPDRLDLPSSRSLSHPPSPRNSPNHPSFAGGSPRNPSAIGTN